MILFFKAINCFLILILDLNSFNSPTNSKSGMKYKTNERLDSTNNLNTNLRKESKEKISTNNFSNQESQITKKESDITDYRTIRNEHLISKGNSTNDLTSNNNYMDLCQNEGEFFELLGAETLQVKQIITYLDQTQFEDEDLEEKRPKFFQNIWKSNILISIRIG